MKRLNKSKFKNYIIIGGILLAVMIATLIAVVHISHSFTYYVKDVDAAFQGAYIEVEQGDLVHFEGFTRIGDYSAVTITARKAGSTTMDIVYQDAAGEVARIDKEIPLQVNALGMIVLYGRNVNGWMAILCGEAVAYLLLAFAFWKEYDKNRRNNLYSFTTIMDMGLGIMFSILAVVFTGLAAYTSVQFMDYTANTAFELTANTMNILIVLTIPAVLVFAIFMVITNISLIRHEGFRVLNLLGIIFSAVMIVAIGLVGFLKVGSGLFIFDLKVVYVIQFTISALVGFAECMFMASAFCCYYAAKKKPLYDGDYVIVLGCRVRKDGSLTPLLRGRVDGAIRYYRHRLETSGKKTFLVPSGGKGNDETLSESEAMANYMMSQGIPKEQILLENQSTNTYENMLFSKRLIGITDSSQRVYFSTTSYHIFRSGMLAYKVGLLNACGIGCPTKYYFWPNAYLREFVGMFKNLRKKLIPIIVLIIVFCVATGCFLL